MSNEAHDTYDGPVLTEHLCDLTDTVTVLREYYHPSARLSIIRVVFLEVDKVVEDYLLELCQLGMSQSQ